jgi:hypothetical protein
MPQQKLATVLTDTTSKGGDLTREEIGMNRISRPLIAAFATVGAAALVLSATLASTAHSAVARPTGAAAPACGNAHPALPGGAFVWATVPGDGFAGGVGYTLEISNVGRTACTVRGVPGAAIEQDNRHLVGGELLPSGKGTLITLKPGATAFFSLKIHEALALCAHPVSGHLVIYLPGSRQAQDTLMDARGCPGMRGGGVLSPGTIKAGTGIPLYSH